MNQIARELAPDLDDAAFRPDVIKPKPAVAPAQIQSWCKVLSSVHCNLTLQKHICPSGLHLMEICVVTAEAYWSTRGRTEHHAIHICARMRTLFS